MISSNCNDSLTFGKSVENLDIFTVTITKRHIAFGEGFTLNVYQHVLPGMQAEAAQIFDQRLAAAIS